MSTPVEIQSEKELEILQTIHTAKEKKEPVVQRDIAHIVGVSLGMTNAILKRLVKKGLLTIKKVNNRNIHYAVSPEGMKALSEKSYRYFKRTIKNVVYYKEKIGKVIQSARNEGFISVKLVGDSDLDFILEHFCQKYSLPFSCVKNDDAIINNNRSCQFVIFSEKIIPENNQQNESDRRTGITQDLCEQKKIPSKYYLRSMVE